MSFELELAAMRVFTRNLRGVILMDTIALLSSDVVIYMYLMFVNGLRFEV